MLAAIPILKEMEKRYPDDKDMLFLIGGYAFYTQQIRIAAQYFDRVLEIDPLNAQALMLRPHVYFVEEKFDEAETFLKTHSFDMHEPPAGRLFQSGVMALYLYRGQYRKALAFAERGIVLGQQNNLPWEAAGIYIMNYIVWMLGWGDSDAANKNLEAAERYGLWPFYMIYAYVLKGDHERAEKVAKEAGYTINAANKTLLHIKKGDCEKAMALADSLLNSENYKSQGVEGYPKFRFLYPLSFCYLEQG